MSNELFDAGDLYLADGRQLRAGYCCASVAEHGMWPRWHQCSRKAVVEREVLHKGERKTIGYCKTHDPINVAARRAERNAKTDAEHRRRMAERERQKLRGEAIDLLREIANGHNDPRSAALEFIAQYDAVTE